MVPVERSLLAIASWSEVHELRRLKGVAQIGYKFGKAVHHSPLGGGGMFHKG